MLGLFIAIGILLIASDIFLFSGGNGPQWFFGLFMILIAGWNLYWIFSFPHRITVSEAGEITFISILRQKKTSIAEIESIKPDPRQFFGFLVIKTQKKKIKILNQFDDFHDFILHLKEKKPSIELRGC